MTAADVAIYDAAFDKQDRDKDGFVSPSGAINASSAEPLNVTTVPFNNFAS